MLAGARGWGGACCWHVRRRRGGPVGPMHTHLARNGSGARETVQSISLTQLQRLRASPAAGDVTVQAAACRGSPDGGCGVDRCCCPSNPAEKFRQGFARGASPFQVWCASRRGWGHRGKEKACAEASKAELWANEFLFARDSHNMIFFTHNIVFIFNNYRIIEIIYGNKSVISMD